MRAVVLATEEYHEEALIERNYHVLPGLQQKTAMAVR
jgi:hypothetical protein